MPVQCGFCEKVWDVYAIFGIGMDGHGAAEIYLQEIHHAADVLYKLYFKNAGKPDGFYHCSNLSLHVGIVETFNGTVDSEARWRETMRGLSGKQFYFSATVDAQSLDGGFVLPLYIFLQQHVVDAHVLVGLQQFGFAVAYKGIGLPVGVERVCGLGEDGVGKGLRQFTASDTLCGDDVQATALGHSHLLFLVYQLAYPALLARIPEMETAKEQVVAIVDGAHEIIAVSVKERHDGFVAPALGHIAGSFGYGADLMQLAQILALGDQIGMLFCDDHNGPDALFAKASYLPQRVRMVTAYDDELMLLDACPHGYINP